jgi:hypothetical protein
MALTSEELTLFTGLNRVEIQRASDVEKYIVVPERAPGLTDQQYNAQVATARAQSISRLVRLSPSQLRARINIDGVQGGIKYSPDNNYTQDEQDAIFWGFKPNRGRSAVREIPEILAHNQEMIDDGFNAMMRKHYHRVRM